MGLGTVAAVPSKDDEWLDADGAARYLAVPKRTLFRLVDEGKLYGLRFPVRIRRSDLDECIGRCRVRPGELAHLDANARRRGAAGEPRLTKKGVPDRRYGPR